MPEETIARFGGEYRFLSNFYPAPVRLRDLEFPTVEHAFQAAKTKDPEARRRIALLATPTEAKQAGRSVELRPYWESIKLSVMHDLLRQKFAPGTELAARLLATGHAELVEGNTWGDRFWGVCEDQGLNHLGRLLMVIRDDLREVQ